MWDDQETRAEVARRRLARLTAEFEQAQARRVPPERAAVTPAVPEEPSAPPRLRLSGAHVRVVGVVLTAAAVVTVWWVLAGRPSEHAVPVTVETPASASPEPAASAATPGAGGTEAGQPLVVDVAGKVRRPGIVELPAGSRVVDAIEAAGGVRGRPDTTSLNLARKLVDGEQVLVGVEAAAVPVAPAPGGVPGAAPAPGAVVDLNTATLEQLDTLPGVGPVTAQAILSWREEHGSFTSVDDLLDVKGIGEATLAELRDLVSAG
ncbi:ComEA family DNA-binding protein [Aeromicrobium massiliense]|uniref:ComEA family DNA-binding protein n=1 Tax=Aeromicrobium massiliense TaxID=1464554 RepID=UPI000A8A9C15|nr:ComEA family DNA-binding protein [Aeromicrobium massiliense]